MTSSNGSISALLAICVGNSPVLGEFPTQRPVTRSFDVFFDLHPNKRLSKQWWGWWFETLSCPLWRHHNALVYTEERTWWCDLIVLCFDTEKFRCFAPAVYHNRFVSTRQYLLKENVPCQKRADQKIFNDATPRNSCFASMDVHVFRK